MTATFSPSPTAFTTSNRRRFSSFEHLNGQEDFRLMHGVSERNHGWSTRSISSFNTDDGAGSTCTEPISNTVRAREMKQKERRRFLSFTKVLVKFLEKKNPTVCKNARNVILQYKFKNKRRRRQVHGEDDASDMSMCESVKAPLKQIVGPAYWKQAKGYLNEMEANENQGNAQSSHADLGNDFEPLSLDANTSYFSDTQVEALSQFVSNVSTTGINTSIYTRQCKRSCPPNENNHVDEERKLRKKRFWMLVRVLMRYIEKKDSSLYIKARATLKDCAKRNSMKEDHFTNLIESVQRELKQTVGIRYWRRAEHHVAKYLLTKANEKAYEDALRKEAAFFGSLDDFTPLPLEKEEEQTIDPCTIGDTYSSATCNKSGWRDPSIPTNVTIPANRSAEDWTSLASCSEHQFVQTSTDKESEEAYPTCTDAVYEHQDIDSIGVHETNRKRRKLWRRPYSYMQ